MEADTVFQALKDAIAQPVLLQFFDVSKPVTIESSSSQIGLDSCVLQNGEPVAYASRSLTNAEENYSQIQKEMLAVCFSR